MKQHLTRLIYSLPVQMLFLHFRRYQVLLIPWYVLFATIFGAFLKPYGADSLMLAPEYLGKVSALSTALVGFSIATFIMSWNITTFILHSRLIKFLATTAQPFLKFCINNGIIPVIFLICYFFNAVDYEKHDELLNSWQIFTLCLGFLGGFVLSIALAFTYFFGTDKNIYRKMATDITSANQKYERATRIIKNRNGNGREKPEMRVDIFLSATFGLRKPRNVRHYSQDFLDSIFKRHHIAAIQAVFIAFVFLIGVGYFSDNKLFQIPAAASIALMFAVLIAVIGALSLFLGNWSILVVGVIYFFINWLFLNNIIDPRNKAYGLNYHDETHRPAYEKDSILSIASGKEVETDKQVYIQMLNAWKARQDSARPVMFLLDVSGGGNRSATFVMNVLMHLDSITGGNFMKQTFLINGASGGMLGAAYFRELYLQKEQGKIKTLQDRHYIDNISKDLLNPVFSSWVTRDMLAPIRKVEVDGNEYIRDRGYSFEQKLNVNTKGVLNKKVMAYKEAEANGAIPLIFFDGTVTRDGRKMIMATHPARFMMKQAAKPNMLNEYDVDAIDFMSFFKDQGAENISTLTAMRMNATFPFVLPNIEMPSSPAIDVMDAGLRDNFGHETTLRFLDVFRDWLEANTSRVVMVEIRDVPFKDWDHPYETSSIMSLVTKPMLLLQNNWMRLQDYYQKNDINYMLAAMPSHLYKVGFSYEPASKTIAASLSFHLTASEKKDIAQAVYNENNQKAFEDIMRLR